MVEFNSGNPGSDFDSKLRALGLNVPSAQPVTPAQPATPQEAAGQATPAAPAPSPQDKAPGLVTPEELGLDEDSDDIDILDPTFYSPEPKKDPEPAPAPAAQDANPLAALLENPALMAQFAAMVQQQQAGVQPAPQPVHPAAAEPEKEPARPEVPAVKVKLAENKAKQGWRGVVSRMGIPVSKSPLEKERDHQLYTLSRGADSPKIIGVGALKGGTGKTTAASTLAAVLAASNRSARVAAVDLDPTGTLKERAMDKQKIDVRGLADNIRNNSLQFSAFASTTRDGVDIFGSRTSITAPEPSADDVNQILTALRDRYDFIVVDLPIYRTADFYNAALHHMDALLYVTLNSQETTNQMMEYGTMLQHEKVDNLKGNTIVVFNSPGPVIPGATDDPMNNLAAKMQEEGIEVIETPFDPALYAPQDFMLSSLRATTYWQYVKLAYMVLELFANNSQEK